jgi:hypothetical protein
VKPKSSAEHTFIVRTWRDATGSSEPEWHGSVEHVATKKRRYFRDFADLSAFIAVHRDDATRE